MLRLCGQETRLTDRWWRHGPWAAWTDGRSGTCRGRAANRPVVLRREPASGIRPAARRGSGVLVRAGAVLGPVEVRGRAPGRSRHGAVLLAPRHPADRRAGPRRRRPAYA